MRRLDLKGKRFGHLVVIDQAPSTDRSTWWRCQCDCGLTCVRQGKRLTMKTPAGWVHSCGCRSALAGMINRQFSKGHARLRNLKAD